MAIPGIAAIKSFVLKAAPYIATAAGIYGGERARHRTGRELEGARFDPERAFNINPILMSTMNQLNAQDRSIVLDDLRDIGRKENAFLRSQRFRAPGVSATAVNRQASRRTTALKGLMRAETLRFFNMLDANMRAEQLRSGSQFNVAEARGDRDAGFFGGLTSLGTSILQNRAIMSQIEALYGRGGAGVPGQQGEVGVPARGFGSPFSSPSFG